MYDTFDDEPKHRPHEMLDNMRYFVYAVSIDDFSSSLAGPLGFAVFLLTQLKRSLNSFCTLSKPWITVAVYAQ